MEIRKVDDRPALAVRLTTSVTELPVIIGKTYGEIVSWMQSKAINISGMPFVVYHNMDMDKLDVEIGWFTAQPVESEGRIQAITVPGGDVLFAVHTGPYSALENTYGRVMTYIRDNKIKTTEWMYEVYLNSPMNTPEDELKTEIYFPIESD